MERMIERMIDFVGCSADSIYEIRWLVRGLVVNQVFVLRYSPSNLGLLPPRMLSLINSLADPFFPSLIKTWEKPHGKTRKER